MTLNDLQDDKNIIEALTTLEQTGKLELCHTMTDEHKHSKIEIKCLAIENLNYSSGGWRPGVYEDGRPVSAGYGAGMDKDVALDIARRQAITYVASNYSGDFAISVFTEE